jgi:P-aminobenzoate N-oxygenase AurF
MTIMSGSILADAGDCSRVIKTLINASHRSYIDLNSYLPWQDGINKKMVPKPANQSWLYGTPYYDELTEEQRLETLWLENARDVSMFIHFEHFLPPLYAGYCNSYGRDLDPLVYEYLLLFSREELTHIMSFQRYREVAELPLFAPPGGWNPFTKSLSTMRPEIGICLTLLVEWLAELGAMHAVRSTEVEPLTRKLFREHHVEETRHLAFGKSIAEVFLQRCSAEEADQVKQLLRGFMRGYLPAYTYNPEIARFTSFRFPVQPDDEQAISTVRNSTHNQQLNNERFKELIAWCTAQGVW